MEGIKSKQLRAILSELEEYKKEFRSPNGHIIDKHMLEYVNLAIKKTRLELSEERKKTKSKE